MVNESYAVLLSPPSSPHMSDARKHDQYDPYASNLLYLPPYSSLQPGPDGYNISQHQTPDRLRTSHSTYNDFPQPVDSSVRGHYFTERKASEVMNGKATHYPPSASASPVDRLTPHSPTDSKGQHDDEDLIDFGGEDNDDGSEKPPMTAAELRAAKRKMKRFRLTHNQTRFLMSEFTRQAHPDAARRERLAREIPGLSARQVQVWFQNRRAKLKRLTNDDRERMMRSRALPAGFDTTQALHSPFGIQPATMGGTISSVGHYTPYNEQSAMRPLTLDTLRRVGEYDHPSYQYSTPTGISPALGGFAFTPPESATEHVSSPSTASGVSSFALVQQAPYDAGMRRPMGITGSSQAQIPSQSSMPRLPLHERLAGTSSEAESSSVRTLGSVDSNQVHQFDRTISYSEQVFGQQRPDMQRDVGYSQLTEQSSYEMGFPHSQLLNQRTSQTQLQASSTNGAQAANDVLRRSGLPASAYASYRSSHIAPQFPAHATHYQPSQHFSSVFHQQNEQQRGQAPREYSSTAPDSAPHYINLGGSVVHSENPGQELGMPSSY